MVDDATGRLEAERTSRRPQPGPLAEGEGTCWPHLLTPEEGAKVVTELAARARREGRSVVFTNGCFDLLHCGHLATLEFAKSLGDVLIVAVNSDESARRLKGDGRPVTSAMVRAASIAALAYVDCAVIFDDDTPAALVAEIRPDVLVKGGEYEGTIVPGGELAGRIEFAPMVRGVSTTEILNQIAWEKKVRADTADAGGR